MKRKSNAGIFIFYAVVLLGAYLFITSALGMNIFGASSSRVSYTELVDAISAGKVASVHIEMGSNSTAYVEATLVDDPESAVKKYYTSYVPADDFIPFITTYSETAVSTFKVDYKILSEDSWTSILMLLMSIGMLVFVFFFFMNQQSSSSGGKMMNFGKSKARMVSPNDAKVNFSDVAGADEEKQELEEIVEFLKSPEKFNRLGARIPKGVLLVGPPGTGKTLLAKATAGEAGVPFFTISGSDFVEMFVGVGASRVRDLFDSAKKNAPCIVFIDEIDAVGRQRGAGLGGGNDEREQTLNQLLVEMDGFTNNQGIIVIAATNRSDILDPALTRPGRFDRQVVVNLPDVRGREEILRVHSRNKKLAEDIDLKTIAKSTSGFTGADLENLMNEAALLAARGKKDKIQMGDITEAIKRVIAGPEKKSRIVTDEDKRITAYHEAGHAIIEHILPNCDSVNEISIIPRGMAAGYTISLPDNDNSHMSRGKLLDEITALLGGRASENVMLDDICTGAVSDIERATEIARKMITAYGMSEKLGPISLGGDSEVFVGKDLMKSKGFSESLSALIDSETRSIIDRCYERAQLIIENNREKVELVVKYLYEREALSGVQFAMLMDEGEEAFLAKFPDSEPEKQPAKPARTPRVGGLFTSLSPQEKEAARKQPPDPIAEEALKVESVLIKKEPREVKPETKPEAKPEVKSEPKQPFDEETPEKQDDNTEK